MKAKLLIFLLFSALAAHAQVEVQRTGPGIIPVDVHGAWTYSAKIPVHPDTATALARAGKDSLGLIFKELNSSKVWVRDTSAPYGHKWTQIGTGGGGGTDSALAALYGLKIAISGTTKYIYTDSFAVQSRQRGLKLADSLAAVLNASLALKKNITDSATNTGSYATRGRVQQVADSLGVVLALKKDKSDSVGPTSYVPRNQIDTFKSTVDSSRTAVWLELAKKVNNLGGSTGINRGAYLSRPSASSVPNTYYWSTDSVFWSYSDGSTWKDLKPGTGGGGSSQTFPQVLAAGRTFTSPDSVIHGFNSFKHYNHSTFTIGDTLRNNIDTTVWLGDSWTKGANQAGSIPTQGFAYLAGWNMNSFVINYGISGSTISSILTTELPFVRNYTIRNRFVFIQIGINDATANSTWVTNYKSLIDSLHLNRGYPSQSIVLLSVGLSKYSDTATRRKMRDSTQAIAIAKGTQFVDFYSAMLNNGGTALVQADSLHPTVKGDTVLFQAIMSGLNTQSTNLLVGGNIGIGTSTPQYSLDIYGTGIIRDRLYIDSTYFGTSINHDSSNITIGRGAGNNKSTTRQGDKDIYIGFHAGALDSSGTNNNVIGSDALSSCKNCSLNNVIGHAAMGGGTGNGASNNAGIGENVLNKCTTCANNVAMGGQVMQQVTTGSNNIGAGTSALSLLTTGTHEVGIGASALTNATDATDNVAVGYSSLIPTVHGSFNTGLGTYSGFANTGSNNLYIGYKAGLSWTGSNKAWLGFGDTSYLFTGDFGKHIVQLSTSNTNSASHSFVRPGIAGIELNGPTIIVDSSMFYKVPDASNFDSIAFLFQLASGKFMLRKAGIGSGLSLNGGSLSSSGGGSSFYQTIQSNTTSQTQRAKLNFSSAFTVTDNSGNGSTDIDINQSPVNLYDLGSGRSQQRVNTAGDTAYIRTQKVDGILPDTASDGTDKINTGPNYVLTADASALANTTSPASLQGTGVGSMVFASNFLEVGDVISIRLRGIISTDATPGNTTFAYKIQNSTSSYIVSNSLPTSLSNVPYDLDIIGVCRATGGSGSINFSAVLSVNGSIYYAAPAAVSTATNTTQTFDVVGQWNTASSSNTMTNKLLNFNLQKVK